MKKLVMVIIAVLALVVVIAAVKSVKTVTVRRDIYDVVEEVNNKVEETTYETKYMKFDDMRYMQFKDGSWMIAMDYPEDSEFAGSTLYYFSDIDYCFLAEKD